MSYPRFISRSLLAVGRHAEASRESLEATLGGVVIGVRVANEDPSPNGIWAAELATNLLARLFPRISLRGDVRTTARLSRLAKAINPDVELVAQTPDIEIACEATDPHETLETRPPSCVYASAFGWVANVSRAPRDLPPGPANPYSAGASACLAVGRVMRAVFGRAVIETEQDYSVSLLDYGKNTGADLELGSRSCGAVAVVGIGAVGNAAMWAWGHHGGLTGEMWLVDPETIDLSNLQRYVGAMDRDIGKQKVMLAERRLRGRGLRLHPVRADLDSFAERLGKTTPWTAVPTFCVSVDNVEARRACQALLPKHIVNGWTGDGSLGVSNHTFDSGSACLACLYHPAGVRKSQTDLAAESLGLDGRRAADLWSTASLLTVEDQLKIADHLKIPPSTLAKFVGQRIQEVYSDVVCGSMGIDLPAVGRREAVPLAHQSALAGVMMAAEVIKRTDPVLMALAQAAPLVSWDNVMLAPPALWAKPRANEQGCICGDSAYRARYAQKWLHGVPT